MRPTVIVALVPLGCTAPDPVWPEIDDASISSDIGSPVALAQVDAVVTLHPSADGVVEVAGATLAAGGAALPLLLDFSAAFDGNVTRGEMVTTVVINVGTSNAQFEGWCRTTAELTVEVGLVDQEPAASDPFPVTVVCFGG